MSPNDKPFHGIETNQSSYSRLRTYLGKDFGNIETFGFSV